MKHDELWRALYSISSGAECNHTVEEYTHDQELVKVERTPLQILALGILELMEPRAWIEEECSREQELMREDRK